MVGHRYQESHLGRDFFVRSQQRRRRSLDWRTVDQEYIALIPQSGNGTLRLAHREGGTQTESVVDWTAAPAQNVEYHFAVVWDDAANVQRLYVDGVLIGTSTLAIDLVDVEDVNNWLGRSQWNDPLFDGYHNEFRIYDRTITSADIAESYEAGVYRCRCRGPSDQFFRRCTK